MLLVALFSEVGFDRAWLWPLLTQVPESVMYLIRIPIYVGFFLLLFFQKILKKLFRFSMAPAFSFHFISTMANQFHFISNSITIDQARESFTKYKILWFSFIVSIHWFSNSDWAFCRWSGCCQQCLNSLLGTICPENSAFEYVSLVRTIYPTSAGKTLQLQCTGLAITINHTAHKSAHVKL